jgi:hypothetical protein
LLKASLTTAELKLLDMPTTFSNTKHRGRRQAMVFIAAQNVFAASSAHAYVCLERETDGASKGKTTRTTTTETNANHLHPCPAPKRTWRKPLEENGVHKKPQT